jgi:hypothetical protein
MIHTTDNFFNKAAQEIDMNFFKDVQYYRDNKECTNCHYALELFNNSAITYPELIKIIARQTRQQKNVIHDHIGKFITSFGSYKPKFND